MSSLRKRLLSLEMKMTRFYRVKNDKAPLTPWSQRKKLIKICGVREHSEINASSRLVFRQQRSPKNPNILLYVCRVEAESPENKISEGHDNQQTKLLQSYMYENNDYFTEYILSNCNQSATIKFNSHDIMRDYKESKLSSPNKMDVSNQMENNVSENDSCSTSLMRITENTYDRRFVKYIPVKDEYGSIYPRYLVDLQSPASWFDVQCWFQQYKIHRSLQLYEALNEGRDSTASCDLTVETSFDRYDDSIVNTDMQNTGDIVVEGKPYQTTDDLIEHPRFGFAANQDYLIFLCERDEMKQCYMQFYFSDNTKHHLFQIKSELLVSCMQAFVQKDADFDVLWVADIKEILPDEAVIANFFSENEDLVRIIQEQVQMAKAALYVTENASILLRHPDTCFLSSLATSVGIERCELVVLPIDIKPNC